MGRITLRQAAQWCGGYVEEKYADVTFLGASNDTREIKPGQLFVALQGARDGNDFVLSAMAAGAAAALCTRRMGDCPAIYVSDTRIALGEIARGERQRLGMKVVGITGSVGKSTTKEMAATVLEGTWRVSKTPVNHNNDIGMPMAILGLPLFRLGDLAQDLGLLKQAQEAAAKTVADPDAQLPEGLREAVQTLLENGEFSMN